MQVGCSGAATATRQPELSAGWDKLVEAHGYAVLFKMYKPGHMGKVIGGILGLGTAIFVVGTGGTGALIIGAAGVILGTGAENVYMAFIKPDKDNGMYLVDDLSKIDNYCTRFENAP